jgi:ankyrin repeat protein
MTWKLETRGDHRMDIDACLCQASSAGNLTEVKRLIENGVSANAQDYDGRTALVMFMKPLVSDDVSAEQELSFSI